jgi:hypothetical protein
VALTLACLRTSATIIWGTGCPFHFFEDLVDAFRCIPGVVEREMEIGNAAELQAFENFVANEVGGVFEP